ncbi:hypothetical protein G6F37_000639 [Rhizopus arrhizus]|nr:hypothetical protein G6F38_005925 [Rhizopus arrhizus]KAG1164072.1 hypothetical protein G6F37_000639 [Rhizopus arrhizus]
MLLNNFACFSTTGVAAHNISGQTIHRFLGLTNVSSVLNCLILDKYVKLFPKTMLLIDKYSTSSKLLESINDALVKTTQRTTIMGGVKTVSWVMSLNCFQFSKKKAKFPNEKDYTEFPGASTEFQAHDACVGDQRTAKIAWRETRLLERLFIKPNMPVMLIHNLHVPTGWVNGATALIEYMEEENICLKKWLPNGNGEIYWIQRIRRQMPGAGYIRMQFPMAPPAFATTIHKAQQLIVHS